MFNDTLDKGVSEHRFCEIVTASCGHAFLFKADKGMGCEGNDGGLSELLFFLPLSKSLCCLVAIHDGHFKIHKNNIKGALLEQCEGIQAISGRLQGKWCIAEIEAEQVAIVLIVIHQQNLGCLQGFAAA